MDFTPGHFEDDFLLKCLIFLIYTWIWKEQTTSPIFSDVTVCNSQSEAVLNYDWCPWTAFIQIAFSDQYRFHWVRQFDWTEMNVAIFVPVDLRIRYFHFLKYQVSNSHTLRISIDFILLKFNWWLTVNLNWWPKLRDHDSCLFAVVDPVLLDKYDSFERIAAIWFFEINLDAVLAGAFNAIV